MKAVQIDIFIFTGLAAAKFKRSLHDKLCQSMNPFFQRRRFYK